MPSLKEGIQSKIGANNVVSMYFPLESTRHIGVCNILYLNAAVYKKFINQTIMLHERYVNLTPHPKSLDGAFRPTPDDLKRLGLLDVNAIIAFENAPN